MKDKYIVINPQGEEFDPQEYVGSCSDNFAVLIRREALGESVGDKFSGKPEYLSVANKMGFNWEPNAEVGFVQYDFKANLIKRLVQEYARMLVNGIGLPIYEVLGSNVFNMEYPVVGAYAQLYGDRLFQFVSGDHEVVMSYDASYPQFNLASAYQLSYRNLPFGHFSISDCYRHEQSGECMLLYRQRRFYMPDVHPYFKSVEEAFEWYPAIEKQIVGAASEVGRKYEVIVEVSSPENWEKYKAEIMEIAAHLGQDVLVGIHNDGKDRYWIINVDYKIIDHLEQAREIGCIQIDVGNASRLGISYVDPHGKSQPPVIIHSAVPGGIERYLYMLFDNFNDSFPLWLYPVQIRLLPVSEQFVPYCERIVAENNNLPVRFEIDDRNESVGRKVRQAHDDLVPFGVVIGEKEVAGGSDELRKAVDAVVRNAEGKPFIQLGWPVRLSGQVR